METWMWNTLAIIVIIMGIGFVICVVASLPTGPFIDVTLVNSTGKLENFTCPHIISNLSKFCKANK